MHTLGDCRTRHTSICLCRLALLSFACAAWLPAFLKTVCLGKNHHHIISYVRYTRILVWLNPTQNNFITTVPPASRTSRLQTNDCRIIYHSRLSYVTRLLFTSAPLNYISCPISCCCLSCNHWLYSCLLIFFFCTQKAWSMDLDTIGATGPLLGWADSTYSQLSSTPSSGEEGMPLRRYDGLI